MSTLHEKRTEQKAKGKPRQSESHEFGGLCLTCNNAMDCVYRQKRGAPSIYCEMFDDHSSLAPSNDTTGINVSSIVADTAASTAVVEHYKGLCQNCDNRVTCAHSNTHEGIWHCEEYRLD